MIRITPFELERYHDALHDLNSQGRILVNPNGVLLISPASDDRRILFASIEATGAERRRRERAAEKIQSHAKRTINGFLLL